MTRKAYHVKHSGVSCPTSMACYLNKRYNKRPERPGERYQVSLCELKTERAIPLSLPLPTAGKRFRCSYRFIIHQGYIPRLTERDRGRSGPSAMPVPCPCHAMPCQMPTNQPTRISICMLPTLLPTCPACPIIDGETRNGRLVYATIILQHE
jgi:hypothetical protein